MGREQKVLTLVCFPRWKLFSLVDVVFLGGSWFDGEGSRQEEGDGWY